MKVLFVTTNQTPDARVVLADLLWLEPDLDIRTVDDTDKALTEIRSAGDYGALFIAPSIPQKEALALIASLRGDRNPIAVVALVTETDRPFVRNAVTAGADEVLVLRGKRLIASLHRVFLRQLASTLARQGSRRPQAPVAPPSGLNAAAEAEIDRLRAALAAADTRIAALSETAQTAAAALAALRVEHDQLRETEAFERALRDRDRAELANVMRELREERDRRVILAGTLTQTEDYAKAELAGLQEDAAAAADRLHRVAHHTQSLQTQLEREFADRVAERDRVTDNALIGHAVFSLGGQLIRCSHTFAAILGYADARDAIDASARGAFAGTPDHQQVLARLDQDGAIDRAESTLRRVDGRPVHVLTSATLLPPAADGKPLVERLVVDLTDQAALEMELRLSRRLEAVGRLAAEMASQIETAAASLEREGHSSPAQRELTLLIQQLVAFSRHQAKPAGFLSLNDAVVRAEPALRQIAGGAIAVQVHLGNVEPVAAGEDDLEHLLIETVNSVAGCLPFGGRLTLATSSETDSTFVLRTTLAVTAAGYGVLPCVTSPSLVRHTARCGGTLRVSGETGRSSTLHVHLPC